MNLAGRRVLVLDGELRSALAVTRSAGRNGATVIVAAALDDSLAGASRYAAHVAKYANPASAPERFLDDVAALCRQYEVTDLLPLSEIALGTLLAHAGRFGGISFPYVDRQTYELAIDKHRLAEIATSLGIKVPVGVLCAGAQDVDRVLARVAYPAVLKPTKSRVFADGAWLASQVQYAGNEAELRERLVHPQYRFPFMIQEFVAGEGKGVFLLYDRGRQVACFSHRRLREKPPTGGVSVLSISERVPELLGDQSGRLLDKLGWHGAAMVEFKVTPAGVPYLMEINPRFWGSLQLAIDAGVDFPAMLLAMRDASPPRQGEFREGVRLRWLLGDLDRLIIVTKSSRYTWWEKVRTWGAFFNPLPLSTRYETFRFDDPRPFLAELRQYVRALL